MAAAKMLKTMEMSDHYYLQWGIYTLISTLTHLQNALAAAEALSLTIFTMEHLSNDH